MHPRFAVEIAPTVGRIDRRRTQLGMRVFVAGKLIQRSWQDKDGNKRQTVEIQVTNVGPDLQFQSAEVKKATPSAEKQSA